MNLSETAAKLWEAGMPEAEALRESLDSLGLEIADFDAGLAYAAAHSGPSPGGSASPWVAGRVWRWRSACICRS